MNLPLHLQAEVNKVCELGLDSYIQLQHRKERRGFIEDGILVGTALSGLSYLGFKQNYLPHYFIPVPLLLSFISALRVSSKHIGESDEDYEKTFSEICAMSDN